MTRITVLGGTGYAGSNVMREAVKRGHQVRSLSRSLPADPVAGATYVTGSVLDPAFLAESVRDTDVLFDALSARGELAGKLQGVFDTLITLAKDAGVRLGVMGGASSLLMAPGGPRLVDVRTPPAELLPEIQARLDGLEALRNSAEPLDWFYVSPGADFGSTPGEALGTYRIGGDVLLRDENGDSNISGADLAKAVVDEIETGAHRRQRFHVAY